MPSAQAIEKQSELFPYPRWHRDLRDVARQYRENSPFPHICLTDFLDPFVAHDMASEFPTPNTDAWTHYKHQNENKLGLAKRDLFPPRLREVTDELNSSEFVEWLSALTGIPGLMADPSLEG